MVAQIIATLIEIDQGGNSTEAQFVLGLERQTNQQFVVLCTCVVLAVFACLGHRISPA